ncbi:hypothetical protein [Nonomuraea rhizosphaerae]|uniref:hypothetical protein n=1 Tax=Nonomuraea rhizosphaerae TaxID=2665663 RepID=UPI001C5D0EC9|nr:hypothetical protein [Nonomuraea rhizosphaerae]
MKRIAALLLALVVHALTLAFVVLGGWTIASGSQFVLSWALGALLLGIGWLLRPRLGRLPADAEVLGRSEAFQLYGMADRVADRIGVRRPAKVAVRDLALDTTYTRNGLLRTPVLVVGLPTWLALAPRQRVALLARAYADLPSGEDLFVGGALSTLAEWRGALMGAAPLQVRDEAQTKIASSLGTLDTVGTGYEVAGFLGRVLGRLIGGPLMLVEYGLTRLARSGDARRAERRATRARRILTAAELAEINALLAGGRYVAPMQAAFLRGESVAAIRRSALAPALLTRDGVYTTPPGAELLGSAESDRLDDELLRHYTRAIRGFGLIT